MHRLKIIIDLSGLKATSTLCSHYVLGPNEHISQLIFGITNLKMQERFNTYIWKRIHWDTPSFNISYLAWSKRCDRLLETTRDPTPLFPHGGHTLPSQINISALDNLPWVLDLMCLWLSSSLVHEEAYVYRTDLHEGSHVQAFMHRDLHNGLSCTSL